VLRQAQRQEKRQVQRLVGRLLQSPLLLRQPIRNSLTDGSTGRRLDAAALVPIA